MRTKEPYNIILGPPGTGKTFRCLSIVDDFIRKKVDPRQICYISFTRKGAYEAKERAMTKFILKEEDLPLFRTVHSLAFHALKMEAREVVTNQDLVHVAKMLGLSITYQKSWEEGIPQAYYTKGDRLFFMENLARTTLKPLKEIWEMFLNDDIDFKELELLKTTYTEHKNRCYKYDYTDLIQRFVDQKMLPNIRVLIVDEAQDLSALQWEMVHLLAEIADHVYIAGDDDQAIYNWAGADIKQFISLPGDKQILTKSYRIPIAVHYVAQKIVEKIKFRNPKIYDSTGKIGKISTYSGVDQIGMGSETGTWLLLARNQMMLKIYAEHCLVKGYIFECKQSQFLDPGIYAAIITWEALRKAKARTAQEVKHMFQYMETRIKIKWGGKKALDMIPDQTPITFKILQEKFGVNEDEPWFKALNKVPVHICNYIRYALANGEELDRKPRITISTIHGAKGGEADNVALITDMSPKTYHNAHVSMDDEHRVWYVAITRTKNQLHVLQPQTQYYYDLPLK